MDAGHGRTANQTFQLIKRLFRWAAERDYIQADPTSGVSRPAKERSRDRVLSDDELASILNACSQLGYPFGSFVHLLALVGQRRSELAKARWQDVDLDKGLWIIPKDLTKSGREHHVPSPPRPSPSSTPCPGLMAPR
jgi:integrase